MKSNKSLVFIYFLAIIFFARCLSSTSYATPIPDIKANNLDEPIALHTSYALSITVSLNTGDSEGLNADWWVVADTPFGWHYYIYPYGWYYASDLAYLQPAYQGALFTLGTVEVLNTTGLPQGTYFIYFAVDTVMNGQIDFDHLYLDGVMVNACEIGSPVIFKRTPLSGIYALGTSIKPDVNILSTSPTLTDDIFNIPSITGTGLINIGSNGKEYQNIGIQLFSSEKPVANLYIYVNRDIRLDTRLSRPVNWRVFVSNFNLPGTWIEIPIQCVLISGYDSLNDIYRYEIRFEHPQYYLFFNAKTMDTATVNDVVVTEIEA